MAALTASLRGWMPVHVALGEPRIDWAVVTEPLTRPFFAETAETAMRRPFNTLFARRTPLDALDGFAALPDVREPAGIIAHVSRAGSTLVTQMLSRLPSLQVLSEPQPFDALLRRAESEPAAGEDTVVRRLRGLVRAFDPGDGRSLVIKLNAWHVLRLALVRRAFPATPWVFVFREPRAVLASHDRLPGAEVQRAAIPAELLGTAGADALREADYGAHVLAAFYRAGLRHAADGRSLFVDYASLPAAVSTRVAPFFGHAPSAAEREAMRVAAQSDAKRGGPFGPPRGAVPDEVDATARRLLDEPYAALLELAVTG